MNIYLEQFDQLIDPSLPLISNLANAASWIYFTFPSLNWAGFYFYDSKQKLCFLGPFQGKVACTTIKEGKGVVGTCAKNQETLYIKNVHTFDGHIACDQASKSELVLPIFRKEELWAVLDIDSDQLDGLSKESIALLEKIAAKLSKLVSSA
ncbi:GAF domain-containing protein [Dubosiella newyorkensis]|jgi:L-methionine (R)-S-oxide reductase|nr:GAF domain-containing protein [Dubosiella newyorkensis]MCI9041949.1 GAF domain-containing protein [Dubosiella newyorkensis]